nr:MAG TPA: hypothetical protein [Caudoviricetes sp.]
MLAVRSFCMQFQHANAVPIVQRNVANVRYSRGGKFHFQ